MLSFGSMCHKYDMNSLWFIKLISVTPSPEQFYKSAQLSEINNKHPWCALDILLQYILPILVHCVCELLNTIDSTNYRCCGYGKWQCLKGGSLVLLPEILFGIRWTLRLCIFRFEWRPICGICRRQLKTLSYIRIYWLTFLLVLQHNTTWIIMCFTRHYIVLVLLYTINWHQRQAAQTKLPSNPDLIIAFTQRNCKTGNGTIANMTLLDWFEHKGKIHALELERLTCIFSNWIDVDWFR